MKVKTSYFKDYPKDSQYFYDWVARLEAVNQRKYHPIYLETALGKTLVWAVNPNDTALPALVIFPGFRTTPLFWDLDGGLGELLGAYRIFLVETNGQPNPSDGHSPSIKSDDYGHWAAQVLRLLGLEQAFIAGASFGGMVCAKIGRTNPEMVKKAFWLNPGGLQFISLSPKNLYYNLLPVFFPKPKNVMKFLEKAVFCKPNHWLDEERMQLILDFEVFALTRYVDKTQKPYDMKDDLKGVKTDVHLILGDKDLLFNTQKSIAKAKKYLPSLSQVTVLPNVGHGIETYKPALRLML